MLIQAEVIVAQTVINNPDIQGGGTVEDRIHRDIAGKLAMAIVTDKDAEFKTKAQPEGREEGEEPTGLKFSLGVHVIQESKFKEVQDLLAEWLVAGNITLQQGDDLMQLLK